MELTNTQGKNLKTIKCPRKDCNSIILKSNQADLITLKTPLPHFPSLPLNVSISPSNILETSSISNSFWVIYDMLTFENIGFSKTIQDGQILNTNLSSSNDNELITKFPPGIKFLSCADCDLGPLGYHDTQYTNNQGKSEFLIAVDRVDYIDS